MSDVMPYTKSSHPASSADRQGGSHTNQLFHIVQARRPDDRSSDKVIRQRPSYSDLSHADSLLLGQFLNSLIDQFESVIGLVVSSLLEWPE